MTTLKEEKKSYGKAKWVQQSSGIKGLLIDSWESSSGPLLLKSAYF